MLKNLVSVKLIFLVTILATLTLIVLQNISIGKSSTTFTTNFHIDTSFSLDKSILAFVHIQKTGGSDFDRNIVKHLMVKKPDSYVKVCTKTNKPSSSAFKFKKYECKRDTNSSQNWYFSRQTFGWACGLHPDITTLKNCLHSHYYPNSTTIDYFTIIREPTQRYLSEWQHVKRGATWIRHERNCLIDKYETCFGEGKVTWTNVSIDEFMACKFNLASNRQTRMLAAFYHKDDKAGLCDWNNEDDGIFLESAKRTLDSMRFFAINEYQYLSQLLFERTFGDSLFKFEIDLAQTNRSFAASYFRNQTKTRRDELTRRIKILNRLDFELYEYGLKLFFTRLKYFKINF
jgi:hypothetical protein